MAGTRGTANRLLATVCAWLLLAAPIGSAAAVGANEYELKAVILYHFAGFVTWPDAAFSDPRAPFVIGIVGRDPFGRALEQAVAGETAQGHPISIVRFSRARDVGICHILFVSSSAEDQLDEILARIEHQPVLTVGETAGFVRRGGVVRFVAVDDRTGFRVNLAAAKAAHLVISSKLLRLADLVGPTKEAR